MKPLKPFPLDELYTELYATYMRYCNELTEPDFSVLIDDPHLRQLRPMTDQEFLWSLSHDEHFSSKWGPFAHNRVLPYLLETEGDMANDRVRWKSLTQEQALFVKNLRVVEGHSWRSVARHYVIEYKLDENVTQLMGVLLCEAARQLLNESLDDGWN